MGFADDLERLAALHRSGALSDAEFASAKARCLRDPAPAADGDSLGRWLRALRRSRSDRWLGGVCGGLAQSTDLPSWLWRLIFAAFALCGGTGIAAYVLLWVVLPVDDGVVDDAGGSLRSAEETP